MVSAWYMDNSNADQREEHKCEPYQEIGLEDLEEKTGVIYYHIDTKEDGSYDEDTLNNIRVKRGYNYQDMVDIHPSKMPDYNEKLKIFFKEHLHADEEIRFITKGSGYFDVRDQNDQWIRIALVAGDMIILPAGIYHRFTLDTKNYVMAHRFFVGEPVWTAHNRPNEDHPARKEYLKHYPSACDQQTVS